MITERYEPLFSALADTPLAPWVSGLKQQTQSALLPTNHGKLPAWQTILAGLPDVTPSLVELKTAVSIGTPNDITLTQRQYLETQLRQFHPWRKGPITLFGIHIDTEWRSDWKWDRVKDAVQPLDGRLVLDVGCGNGYHMWRMMGMGARLAVGVDPYLPYVMQYQAVHHFVPHLPAFVLPLGIEALPRNSRAFDTVFSMGVLYHRRSPFDHLLMLRDTLRPGGELVLETLVIDGEEGRVLVPRRRYAQMRNVWFIPSPPTLVAWLAKCRFQDIQLVDVTPTTPAEQRTTPWMTYQSLPDFLDPHHAALTIEGYPAPKRAVITAVSPP